LPIYFAHADKIGQAPLPRCRRNKEQRKLSDVVTNWSLRFQLQKLDEKSVQAKRHMTHLEKCPTERRKNYLNLTRKRKDMGHIKQIVPKVILSYY